MIPFQGKGAGGLEVDGGELHLVPRLQLTKLPKIRLDHRHRAHEPAKAWAIRAEDDRHVTGEIHGTNRIRIVVNVRRMQTRLATVGTHPFRLRPDQAHAGAAGVEVHFPLRGEEGADVVFGEVFRRTVGAVDHADLPNRRQLGDLLFSQLLTGAAVIQRWQVQHVTGPQGAATVPAKLPQGEGAFAAQIIRYLQAATQAQITAGAHTGDGAEAQAGACRNHQRSVHRHALTVEQQWNHRPGHRHHRLAIEAQQRPAHGDLQRRRAFVVAQQTVTQAQRATVHRP
ncbi:hypothetical protein D3C76_665600 [compost metagenome]